ncbi:MAG: hypothetical protein JWM98_3006 [Thermoleophilia bacterium]|nr:hypothetical protein [Thermoleophilia bacterium]
MERLPVRVTLEVLGPALDPYRTAASARLPPCDRGVAADRPRSARAAGPITAVVLSLGLAPLVPAGRLHLPFAGVWSNATSRPD